MKSVVSYGVFLIIACLVHCEDLPKPTPSDSKDVPLTLLTLFNGNVETDEALTRFVRRAIFNGFQQGSSLRIIEATKASIASSAPPEVVRIETIRSAVKKLAREASEEDILLYVEHDLTMVLSSPEQISQQFKATGHRVLFSTDATPCLSDAINSTINGTTRYANFAGFIGYVKDLGKIFLPLTTRSKSLAHLFSHLYSDEAERVKAGIGLDMNSTLFHTIMEDSSQVNLELTLSKDGVFLFPTLTTKKPAALPVHILQTNVCKSGNSLTYLNALGSYLTPTLPEDKLELPEEDEKLPVVSMSIFIERPTPFMEEFFINIEDLDYPKDKIHLFIHNHFKYNSRHVEAFLEKNSLLYKSVKCISSSERVKEWAARKMAVNWALETKSDYWFSVDSTARLDEESALRNLIEANKLIVSPMLCTNTDYLPNICNWWGSLSRDGFYAKSSDFDDIAEDRHKGIWNVPFVNSAYLVKASILQNNETRPVFIQGMAEPDLAFAAHNRARGIFMHLTNEFHPGHLVSNDHFDIGHFHDDLYQIFDNRFDWDNRYIHPNYSKSLDPDHAPLEPCRDVYWFPIVTPRFATEMIEEMENYGHWADGSIEARGDLYPTVDIQMHEIGYAKHFHEFLRVYITPLQEKVFKDYEVYPPKTDQAFVVRYSAEDQRELRPHFDESTYTLNIALNTPHKDFQGGGCRFTRFNCSVVDTRLGWGFLHPGQFTHKHEGLKVTNGTRYILVAFIDPHDTDEE